MHIAYSNSFEDLLQQENIEDGFGLGLPNKRLIIGSFLMFVIFSYLKLLYILVAVYLALHHIHI